MIIQICGTNGSGKSTAIRRVMSGGKYVIDLIINDRVWGHHYRVPGVSRVVLVMGVYGDAATGGCDRISDVKSVRPVIADAVAEGHHVLFEGIHMMSHTDGALFARAYGQDYVALLLSTPLAECLDGIRARQEASGKVKDVVVRSIASNITRASNYAFKLSQVGARKVLATRDEAPGKILELLRSAP